MRNTMSQFYQGSGFQKQLAQKLAYEWKNIYRALSNADPDNLGIAKLQQFQKACSKCAVDLDRKDLLKLAQSYGLQPKNADKAIDHASLGDININYRTLSMSLGLHKDSFNYFN